MKEYRVNDIIVTSLLSIVMGLIGYIYYKAINKENQEKRIYNSTRASVDSLASEIIQQSPLSIDFQEIDPNIALRILPHPIDTSLEALTQSKSKLEKYLGMSNAIKNARRLYEEQ